MNTESWKSKESWVIESMIKVLPDNSSLNKCSECKENIGELRNSCSKFKSMCENCTFIRLYPGHYIRCASCQNTFAAKIHQEGRCYSCIKNASTMYLPLCNYHKYCADCINDYSNSYTACSKCRIYFNFYKFPLCCFICEARIDPIAKNECARHYICRNCLFFLWENKSTKIEKLDNCGYCSKMIKIKSKQKIKTNVIIQLNLTTETDLCLACKKSEIFFTGIKLCESCTNKYWSLKINNPQFGYKDLILRLDKCKLCMKSIGEKKIGFRNTELLCGACSYNDFDPAHYLKSENCLSTFEVTIRKEGMCNSCFKIKPQIFMPMCHEHSYCATCVINYKNIQPLCNKCRMYFTTDKNKSLCFICSDRCDFYRTSICISHYICTRCIKFIIDHKTLQIEELHKCRDCIKLITPDNKFEDYKAIYMNTDKKRCLDCKKNEQTNINGLCNSCDYKKNFNFESKIFPLEVKICPECNAKGEAVHRYDCKYRDNAHCYFCKSNLAKLYQTSKCSSHYYCENCLSHSIQKISMLDCINCYNYFHSLNPETKDYATCNNCQSNKISILKCKTHNYCHECLTLIIKNDYTKYPNIISCFKCVENLKKIIKDTSGQHFNTANNNLIPALADNVFQSEFSSSNALVNVSNFNRTLFQVPSINQHEKMLFDDNLKILISLEAPHKPSISNPTIIKYNTLNSPKNSKKNSLASIESERFASEPNCSYCNAEGSITAFLCNHNYCLECLIPLACLRIYEFFNYYKNGNNLEVLRQQFFYVCLVNGCGKKIRIPIEFLKKCLYMVMHESYLPKNLEYFIQMKKVYSNIYQIILDRTWNLYFDGIKSSFAFT